MMRTESSRPIPLKCRLSAPVFMTQSAAMLSQTCGSLHADRRRSGAVVKVILSFGLILVFLPVAGYAQSADEIGYPTVKDALEALRGNPAAKIVQRDGWTIVETTDRTGEVLWSFTPLGHPAHPSVVKRTISEQGDEVSIDTRIRCEAAPAACDRLFDESVKTSEQTRLNLKKTRAAEARQ